MQVRVPPLALFLIVLLPVSALAFVPRTGDTVAVTGQIRDDLYAAGGTVEVVGQVDGDVVAAGGTVTLAGPVTGGILAAGGSVSVRGATGRSIRAAGGSLSISGPVAADAVLAGGSVEVEQTAVLGRDLVATGGNLRLSGTVKRNAYLTGDTITIGGTVQGDVHATGDRIVLLPTARVAGRLRYASERGIEIQSGARVAGQVTRVSRPSAPGAMFQPAARFGFPYAGRVLEIVWLVVLGSVLLAVAPGVVQRVREQVAGRLGMSALTGFVLLVAVPVAAVLLLITIVGIPLAAIVMLLYFAALYPGQVFVSAWLGDRIVQRLNRGRKPLSPYLTLALGVVALIVLVSIPFIGWLVRLLAVLTGFGAVWAAVWGARGKPESVYLTR